jgi:casein kinase II subunit alpha
MGDPASDPFDIVHACVNGRFNPAHPNISPIYSNVNLDRGPGYWEFRRWTPDFGDITRYKLVEWVGSGRYSDVFLALCDGAELCAVKVLKPVNTDRVRRELKVLLEVQGHRNVLRLTDIVIDGKLGIPSMVTEAIGDNIPWRDLFAEMTIDDARFYIYRILQALHHTHSHGIIHRDVKPLNVLCSDPRRVVKLADWGLAEFYHPLRRYSVHVATRYYKSPELLMDYDYYDYSMDIWSAGTMLLEILSQKLHVFDGFDNEHQIDAIAAVTGGRPMLAWAERFRIKVPDHVRERLAPVKGVTLESLIPYSRRTFRNKHAIDLAQKMLRVDHRERITAEDALEHPFFKMVKDADAAELAGGNRK